MEELILVGFGGHAKSVADSIEDSGQYRIAGFTDMKALSDYHGYPYLGKREALEEKYRSGIHRAVVSIGFMGNGTVRDELYDMLREIGYELPPIIDPTAIVSSDAVVEEGAFIGKGAIINAGSVIGKMCIINTGAVVEHENCVGAFSHISVHATLCGRVTVGEHTLIGAGTTVIQDTHIGGNCIIGAGSIVLGDVPDGEKAYGTIKHPFR